jgi:hypothetical protein
MPSACFVGRFVGDDMSEQTPEITAKIIARSSDAEHTIFGGDPSNPTWEQYLDQYEDKFKPHIIAIRKAIEASEWMKATAENFCNNHIFECSDGVTFAFTWRAWGDLMQAIVGKNEGYMTYYM